MTSTHSQCKTLQIMILLLERLTYLCYGKVRPNCETPTGLWLMSSMSLTSFSFDISQGFLPSAFPMLIRNSLEEFRVTNGGREA